MFNKHHQDLIWNHNRFIDDLFTIWNNDLDSLNFYFNTLNNFQPNFKFTLKYLFTFRNYIYMDLYCK